MSSSKFKVQNSIRQLADKSKNLRTILVVIFLGTLLLSFAGPVSADRFGINRIIKDIKGEKVEKREVEKELEKRAQQKDQKIEKQGENLDKLKEKANKMVDKRVSELNKLLSRIQNDSKLSNDERSSISKDVQDNINGLNALKAKINADTDAETARADAKKIVINFKIYDVEVPKTKILIATNNLSKLSTELQELAPKLQDFIDSLKSQGKDVSEAQAFLDDMNNRLQTIVGKLTSDKSSILAVVPASTNSKTTFAQVRKDLAQVRASFAQIRHDIGRLRGLLKVKASPSPSPTLTNTPTPTPTP